MPLVVQRPTDRIILGLMTFGPDPKTGGRVTDVNEFGKILDHFQSRGYNEVDTARMYIGGKQEAFTAQAGWKDRGLSLATKIRYPVQGGDNTADKVLASAETSLKDLGTDTVDVSGYRWGTGRTTLLTVLTQVLYLHAAVCTYSPP